MQNAKTGIEYGVLTHTRTRPTREPYKEVSAPTRHLPHPPRMEPGKQQSCQPPWPTPWMGAAVPGSFDLSPVKGGGA